MVMDLIEKFIMKDKDQNLTYHQITSKNNNVYNFLTRLKYVSNKGANCLLKYLTQHFWVIVTCSRYVFKLVLILLSLINVTILNVFYLQYFAWILVDTTYLTLWLQTASYIDEGASLS